MGGTYRPHPKSALDVSEWPCPLGKVDEWYAELFVRQAVYRGMVRDFSISVWVFETSADEQRFEVEAVDCCEGELHRHRLRRSAPLDRQSDRHRICELNQGDEPIVNREFDVQYGWMLDNWESLVRRWNNG